MGITLLDVLSGEVWLRGIETGVTYLWENPLELIAVITGTICVYLNTREIVWAWPIGIVSVGIYVYIFLGAKLYSDAILHIIYVILGFYGWYHWLYGGRALDTLAISRLSARNWGVVLAIGVGGTALWGWFFDTFTDASLAYWDAYTTVFSLIGQVLLARKIRENWLLWIAVDLIAIGIYIEKALFLTALLYVVYTGLAVWGWFQWDESEKSPRIA